MPNNNYTEVICIAEVPDRPFHYKVGGKYSSTSSRDDNGVKYWVGIPSKGGHHFTQDEFLSYFK